MLKIQNILSLILAFALVSLSACRDDFPYEDIAIGEGEALVETTINFVPFGDTQLGSRASGSAIRDIETLYLLCYNTNEELISCDKIENYTVDYKNNNRPEDEAEGTVSAETNTAIASFQFQIPYGRYYMYAVANIDIDADWGDQSNYDTVDKLLNRSVTWTDDVSRNNQMFGYFTSTNTAEGHRAPEPVIINKNNTSLTAWIKRVASKVTVAFDTRQLRENIYIYLRSVKIHDIPEESYIGRDNTPGAEDREISDDLLDGETLYFGGATKDDLFADAKAHYPKWRKIASGDSIYGYHSNKNGLPPADMYNTAQKRLAYEHGENVEALYFFENMQHKGKSKKQDADNDLEIDYPEPDKDKPGSGWKDEKPYGTYVEVEGYYVSEDSVRPGRGPIRYRFMLGQDTEYDYDAVRNRHYKLTLQFKGYANDYDWHIDYQEEAKPGSVAPDTAYVSYFYNQSHSYTVRSTPRQGYKLVSVDAVILQNEWRPDNAEGFDHQGYDIYNKKSWRMQMNSEGYFSDPQFDTEKNDPDRKINDPNCEFGFLSLRKSDIRSYDLQENNTATGLTNLKVNARKVYFEAVEGDTEGSNGHRILGDPNVPSQAFPQENTPETGKSLGSELDGTYTVHLEVNKRNGERNYAIGVPLYTRAKSIGVNWAVYTGGNPYYEYSRKAYVRTVMRFVALNDSEAEKYPPYQDTCYTTVMQVPRIDNPRAIYRKHDNRKPFRVKLLSTLTVPHGDQTYMPVVSHGPWSAEIERDPYGLVKLTKGTQIATGEGNRITGKTETEVDFTYTPNRTVGSDQAIGAIITVRYNNNQCVHKIIVRQGYGPVQFSKTGLTWLSYNVYSDTELTKSPLSVGSFFRYNNNTRYPIAESNNYRTDYGGRFNQGQTPKSTDVYKLVTTNTSRTWTWDNIYRAEKADDVSPGKMFLDNNVLSKNGYRLPTASEVKMDILDNNDIQIAFGVAYGDGASGALDTNMATGFRDTENTGNPSPSGVMGAVIYCLGHGDNLFFPFGATGHARRINKETYVTESGGMAVRSGYGMLAYGDVSGRIGGDNTASAAGPKGNAYSNDANNYRPLAYRLPDNMGGIYWVSRSSNNSYDLSYMGLDFNSANNQVSNYPTSNLFNSDSRYSLGSDALPIRPVKN
ncbi:MAG: hypothetical protein K2M72_02845 [Paramuribaculum sp.]|nr:hypothetical protein [Paramuribaculum sp.]